MRAPETYRAHARNAVKAAGHLAIWREKAAASAMEARKGRSFKPVPLDRVVLRDQKREAKAQAYRDAALAGGGMRERARRGKQIRTLRLLPQNGLRHRLEHTA